MYLNIKELKAIKELIILGNHNNFKANIDPDLNTALSKIIEEINYLQWEELQFETYK